MKKTLPLVLVVSGLAVLHGCERKAAPAAVDAGVASTRQAQPVETPSAPDASAYPPPVPSDGFEAEIVGALIEKPPVRGAKYIAINTREPCDAKKLETVYLSAVQHIDLANEDKQFFIEPWVRDGDQLHLCAFALDATGRKVLSFGAYEKNPITFSQPAPDPDHEDVHFELEGANVTLLPLKPPLVLKTQRF